MSQLAFGKREKKGIERDQVEQQRERDDDVLAEVSIWKVRTQSAACNS